MQDMDLRSNVSSLMHALLNKAAGALSSLVDLIFHNLCQGLVLSLLI
jgi:hypothetical protein